MRLEELTGKEIINVKNGSRLGVVDGVDFQVIPETGEIVSIIMPGGGRFFSFFKESLPREIPWQAVKLIGSQVILVELDNTY
ncbi:YlmC/YmxH family sporulation protein [Carboxydothermus pertinax]|uniref:Sporulation protein n=1 Tax=Carboxydothermus pertinax TaxID=870242 RepID=A0A1L8CW25_9THEO|nr:YlmC/YmxH family sporulation protein [Carboxydothermus pertinax]GAV23097.1 sporulation protein [Carboxydothermus pertinax]